VDEGAREAFREEVTRDFAASATSSAANELRASHNWHSSVSHVRADRPYSGLVESTKHAWTNERMDEFAERTEENFKEVRREIRDTRSELRAEMNERFAGIEQRFNILFGALATGFVGAVVAHFLG
jgi:hypothetical protein